MIAAQTSDQTQEREFGWVFYYTNTELVDSGNPYRMLAGLGPLVVNRNDGAARFLSSSVSPNAGIDTYEEVWRAQRQS